MSLWDRVWARGIKALPQRSNTPYRPPHTEESRGRRLYLTWDIRMDDRTRIMGELTYYIW